MKGPTGWVLALLMVVIAVYLWLIDLLSGQRLFGALLASELVAFALLVHIYSKPSFSHVSKMWLVTGCFVLALFFFFALTVATQ